MAARNLFKEFCEEVTCSICLEYFKEPVTVECGHNFCRACLTQCWAKADTGASCPQCREMFQQTNFRPNRQLMNLVELVKKSQLGKGVEGEQRECERHREPLKLFCFNDQAPICVVCDRSMGHQNHKVLPLEEAFLVYKKEIQAQLQWLEQERENLQKAKKEKDQRSQKFLAQLKLETQKTKSAFQQMHNYLKQQEGLRLSQLEKMEAEIKEREKENHARFSEEISDLSHLISELEGKFQQPETVFVQDPKTVVSRHEKKPERQLVELPPILEQNLRIYSAQTPELQKALIGCEESLAKVLVEALTKVDVTLDPETAHPNLVLSKDLKSAVGKGTAQNLPSNPERFDTLWSVLGREKFTSGRHWWEVDLGNACSSWSVGVARESVRRKGNITRNPEEGFWILQTVSKNVSYQPYQPHAVTSSLWEIHAVTSSQSVTLSRSLFQKIRVLLDYEKGIVEFFSAAANAKLFTFPSTSFSGEALCPYFSISNGCTLKC